MRDLKNKNNKKNNKKLLVIDDEEHMRHMLSVLLQRENFQVSLASNGQQGLESIRRNQFDIVLCDIKMPEMDGLEFLSALKDVNNNVPVVMMSAFGTVDLAVQAMKKGADDFITKPFKGEEVVLSLKKAIGRQRLKKENEELRRQLNAISGGKAFARLVGKSEELRRLIAQATKIAKFTTTVLITGESGTGKELFAQGIHKASRRREKPFVPVNCGSIPESLLESELFGYVKGAFTGADRNKKGLFKEADGGTLFLDEIGELPAAMQVKLLRVLQENEFRPVGAGQSEKINVRIIAATAKDLALEVETGGFRQDLFYRLNVVHIHLPSLRKRLDDLPLLCAHFLKKYSLQLEAEEVREVSPAAMQCLLRHPWPGNVRELENVMERAVILADKNVLLLEDLPEKLRGRSHDRRLSDLLGTFSLKEGKKILEHRLIARALEFTGGNKSRASELLEISYPSLLAKIKEYKL